MLLESHLNDLNEAYGQSELIGQLTFNMDYYSFQLLDFPPEDTVMSTRSSPGALEVDVCRTHGHAPHHSARGGIPIFMAMKFSALILWLVQLSLL